MHQIQLSNRSFEGDNNVYLFDDGPQTVLVDTGDPFPETEDHLATELDARGIEFADVDRIFLTHWHGDHVGLARTIQDESGCTVHVHSADAPLVGGEDDAWEAMAERQQEQFDHWKMPEEDRAVLREIFQAVSIRDNPPSITPLEDGDTFSFNGRTMKAVHAPGHAAGLCLYELELDGQHIALTGDALLPVYTPNVGGADVRVDRPLERYLETLQNIVAADYDRAWPGHRDVIEEPAQRAQTILEHHEERAYRVLDALRRLGPADTWTLSADLFGDLEGIHNLHGPGETDAHLGHLERSGQVVRDGDLYRLADGVAAELADLSDERWEL